MTTETFDGSVNPNLMATVQCAYHASFALGTIKGVDRSRAVQAMAQALKSASDDILEANTLYLEASREMAIPELILEWQDRKSVV